jgi:hypothetical protein
VLENALHVSAKSAENSARALENPARASVKKCSTLARASAGERTLVNLGEVLHNFPVTLVMTPFYYCKIEVTKAH